MIRRRLIAAALAATLLANPALAQAPAAPDGGEATVVEELVVVGSGGPAWWTVSDGDSTVYVLAMQWRLPKGAVWNQSPLERRLTGANRLILPVDGPDARPSPLDLLVLFRYRVGMSTSKLTLEPGLEPALRARFVAAREALGRSERRYGTFPPGAAAMLLAGDTYQRWFPPGPVPPADYVMPRIRAVAKAKGVRAEAPRYTGPRLGYKDMISDLTKPGQACTAAILADLEKGPPAREPAEAYRQAAEAWTVGDVRPMLRWAQIAERTPPSLRISKQDETIWLPPGAWNACVAEMPNTRGKVFSINPVPDTVQAIARQLATPGHAVALVYPYPLLRTDGVLDRLRRQGFVVTAPVEGSQ